MFKKGQSGNPAGRKKGVPTRATANAKEAIARFIDGNSERLQALLDEIYVQEGPRAAFDCFKDLLEFHVPKLARTELTGKDGGNLTIEVVRFADKTPGQ